MSEGSGMLTWVLAIVAAPFVLALVVAALRQPMRVALPLFAALIPFGGALSVGASKFGSLSSLAGLLLGAGLALQLVTNRRSAPRLSPSVPLWLLFLSYATLTALWSFDRGITVSTLLVLASLVLVFLLVAVSDVDRVAVRRTENALLVGGVAVVLYGLYQLLVLGGFPDKRGGGVTAGGRFGNDLLDPNLQAVALLLPLSVSLTRAFAEDRGARRLLDLTIAALMFWGVMMTGSRAGTLAVGVVVVTLLVSAPRRARKGLLAAMAAGLAVAAVVWVFHPAGIAERSSLEDSKTSSSGRTDIWLVGMAACEQYCAYGSGWGTFPEVYAKTQATVPGARVLSGPEGTYQPHNLWLGVAVELGIPGLLLLALALAFSLVEALRLPVERRGPPLASLVGLLFAVFFVAGIEFKFFWMVLMLVAVHRNLTVAETTAPSPAGEGRASAARDRLR